MTPHPHALTDECVLSALRRIEGATGVNHAGILISAVIARAGEHGLALPVRVSLSFAVCRDLARRASHARLVGVVGQRELLVYTSGAAPVRFSSEDAEQICGPTWPVCFTLTLS